MTHGPFTLPRHARRLSLLAPAGLSLALLLPSFGCSSGSDDSAEPAATTTPAAEEDKAPEQIDAAALREDAKTVLWVPNPSEIQNALRALEVSTDVSSLVTTKAFDFRPMDGPQIALNTGVVTADLVLTVEQSSNEEIAARVDLIKQGLTELGANQELLDTAGQFAERVRAGRLERDAIISELDAFQSSFLDGVERYSSTDAAVGLQAGAWVEAVHIIATTLATNDAAANGAHIFRQPYVVEYFLAYIRSNAEKAGDGTLLEGVVPAMEELLALTRKEELSAEDVATIRDKTGTILGRF